MSFKMTTESTGSIVAGAITCAIAGIAIGMITTKLYSRSNTNDLSGRVNGMQRGLSNRDVNGDDNLVSLMESIDSGENSDWNADDPESIDLTQPIMIDGDRIGWNRPISLTDGLEVNPYVHSRVNVITPTLTNISPEQIESILKAKGKEIRMNAPVILRQHFEQKGYAIIQNNLSHTNTKLNEFAELMRMDGLSILNGCEDPDNCECNFRHKRCRLFIARYNSYSDSRSSNSNGSSNDKNNDFRFYSSNCQGIMRIRLANEDGSAFLSDSILSDHGSSDVDSDDLSEKSNDVDQVDNNTPELSEEGMQSQFSTDTNTDTLGKEINHSLNESLKIIQNLNQLEEDKTSHNLQKLVNLFEEDFTDSCIDIVEYMHYIIGTESSNYTADIIFIADPFYEGYRHTQDNGYGRPDQHVCDESCVSPQKFQLDDDALTCCMDWHQDIFCDPDGDCHPYDFVALFVLNGRDITPHQLNIGKAEYDSDADAETDDIESVVCDNVEIIETKDSDDENEMEMETITDLSKDIPNDMDGVNDIEDNEKIGYTVPIITPRSPVPVPPPPKSVKHLYSINLDKAQVSDIGYLINQQRDLYHRHSKFTYNSTESRRNVLAIRFRYYDN
jgi:hypothetical protein